MVELCGQSYPLAAEGTSFARHWDCAGRDKAQHLLLYIEQHIDPAGTIAFERAGCEIPFVTYLHGAFFKRNFWGRFQALCIQEPFEAGEELLTGSRMSVKEIASRMGYIDSCYLNKLFRQHHGVTPTVSKDACRLKMNHLSPLYYSQSAP